MRNRLSAESPLPRMRSHVRRTRAVTLTEAGAYLDAVRWQFARTMPQWPHWYTLRSWRPDLEAEFEAFVRLVRECGEVKPWPRDSATPRYHFPYLAVGEWEYWSMGAPVEVTTVINRARLDAD